MTRPIIRVGLFIAFLASIAVIAVSLWFIGPSEKESWAVIAAALAVMTAILSSWSTQKTLELQEDTLKPYPYPFIDVKSRYGLMQLRVTNFGGTAAHDIRLQWDAPLLNREGQAVCFTSIENAPDIAVLLPGDSIAILVGGSLEIYQKYQNMEYSGVIEFRNASGRKKSHKFRVSAEQYRHTLTHEQEEPKTQRELQKIPEELHRIDAQLAAIRTAIGNLSEGEE